MVGATGEATGVAASHQRMAGWGRMVVVGVPVESSSPRTAQRSAARGARSACGVCQSFLSSLSQEV